MPDLARHIDRLRTAQNPDGGWGYFPRKQSWLEPTVYCALALARSQQDEGRVRRAWNLVRSWQNADGGWRPCAGVSESTWTTALAITMADVLGERAALVNRGVHWLMSSAGAESSTLNRTLRFLGVAAVEREVNHPGWSWNRGTSAWVEPTAHTLVALRKVNARTPERRITERIDSGERMLLDVRCRDGGWNYGSPAALGIALPSYAETTGLALIGLGARAPRDAVDRAAQLLPTSNSRLAQSWLRAALRLCGGAGSTSPGDPNDDLLIVALEALDCDLLKPGAHL